MWSKLDWQTPFGPVVGEAKVEVGDIGEDIVAGESTGSRKKDGIRKKDCVAALEVWKRDRRCSSISPVSARILI